MVIKWDSSGINTRIAVVELCGWRNRKNNATPIGKRIARQSWNQLSERAKNVLIRNGIVK